MAQILSTEILERLLHTVGAPTVTQPGLTIEAIHRQTVAFPGTLPAEAELWWSWRTWGEGGDMLPEARYTVA